MTPFGTVVYSAGNTKELVLDKLDSQQEIRTLRTLLVFTLISTAAAFALAMPDYNTIGNKLITRLRISADLDDNNESFTFPEWRTAAIDATGHDPCQEFQPIGTSIPISSGSPLQFKFPIDANYTHEALDCPNLYAISSDQLNVGAAKISIDWAAAPGNIVLTNGTATPSINDARVQYDSADAHMVFAGPHWMRKTTGGTAQFDAQNYPAQEFFLAEERTPAAFLAALGGNISISRDGRFRPRNADVTELAALYIKQRVKSPGGETAIDITNNSVGGGNGAIVSPVLWLNSRIRMSETEIPSFLKARRVEFPAGLSLAYNFMSVKTLHMQRQTEIVRAVMGNAGVGGAPNALAVRGFGGGENNTLAQFKGRAVKLTDPA